MADDNPMMALLSQHTEETELDKLYQKHEPAKQEKSNPQGPIIVLDDDDDSDDAPIGLTHRQPSFSSLHGHITMKGGETIPDLPQLTEEPDEEANNGEEDEDVPIGLNVRHSSYASLSLGNAIPKGRSKPTKAKNIIAITEDIAEDDGKKEDFSNTVSNQNDQEEEDFEEDEDPNVIIVKQLKEKNSQRWKEMGYEPPKNLIPLVRAASQNQLSVHSVNSNQSGSTLTSIAEKLPDPLANVETIAEVEEEPENKANPDYTKAPLREAPTPSTRKRSGSFGMKLGEASSSQALMESIIHETPATIEVGIDDINEDDNAINEEEEEFLEEEEGFLEEDDLELFGRLNEIVTEEPGSPLYEALQNGYADDEDDIPQLRRQLNVYLQMCQRNRWDDEEDFISTIISRLPQSGTSKAKQQEADFINQQIVESYMNRDKEIEKIQKQLDDSLSDIDKEYLAEAEELDNMWQDPKTLSKYNKPSSELINLRSKLKNAMNVLPYREIEALKKQVATLEEKETKTRNSSMVRNYHQADRAMKEKYVKKRVLVTKKYENQISTIETTYDQKIALLKSQLHWSH